MIHARKSNGHFAEYPPDLRPTAEALVLASLEFERARDALQAAETAAASARDDWWKVDRELVEQLWSLRPDDPKLTTKWAELSAKRERNDEEYESHQERRKELRRQLFEQADRVQEAISEHTGALASAPEAHVVWR